MSEWVTTKDGRLLDVHEISENYVYGFLILENDFKLRVGDPITVKKSEVIDYMNKNETEIISKAIEAACDHCEYAHTTDEDMVCQYMKEHCGECFLDDLTRLIEE